MSYDSNVVLHSQNYGSSTKLNCIEVRFGGSVLVVPKTSKSFLITGGFGSDVSLKDCILSRYETIAKSKLGERKFSSALLECLLDKDIQDRGSEAVLENLYEVGIAVLGAEVLSLVSTEGHCKDAFLDLEEDRSGSACVETHGEER